MRFPNSPVHLFITFVLAGALVPGQSQSYSGAEQGGNLPVRPIASNDLLAVTVYGAPELSRTVRVSGEGLIRLPMLGDTIEASGLLPAEVESRIAEELSRSQVLVEPSVTVTIAEYYTRPISVAGAVRHPLTFVPTTDTTLLEALTRAEGLSPEAGLEVLVTWPDRPELRVPVKQLMEGADPALNVKLKGGEEVRVPQVGRIFVVGNVKHPGGFRTEDGTTLTVLKALAFAEGLAPFATKQAYIYRRVGEARTESLVPIRRILDRKSPDLPLEPDDVLYVPDNRTGRTASATVDKALSFMIGTASGAIVLNAGR